MRCVLHVHPRVVQGCPGLDVVDKRRTSLMASMAAKRFFSRAASRKSPPPPPPRGDIRQAPAGGSSRGLPSGGSRMRRISAKLNPPRGLQDEEDIFSPEVGGPSWTVGGHQHGGDFGDSALLRGNKQGSSSSTAKKTRKSALKMAAFFRKPEQSKFGPRHVPTDSSLLDHSTGKLHLHKLKGGLEGAFGATRSDVRRRIVEEDAAKRAAREGGQQGRENNGRGGVGRHDNSCEAKRRGGGENTTEGPNLTALRRGASRMYDETHAAPRPVPRAKWIRGIEHMDYVDDSHLPPFPTYDEITQMAEREDRAEKSEALSTMASAASAEEEEAGEDGAAGADEEMADVFKWQLTVTPGLERELEKELQTGGELKFGLFEITYIGKGYVWVKAPFEFLYRVALCCRLAESCRVEVGSGPYPMWGEAKLMEMVRGLRPEWDRFVLPDFVGVEGDGGSSTSDAGEQEQKEQKKKKNARGKSEKSASAQQKSSGVVEQTLESSSDAVGGRARRRAARRMASAGGGICSDGAKKASLEDIEAVIDEGCDAYVADTELSQAIAAQTDPFGSGAPSDTGTNASKSGGGVPVQHATPAARVDVEAPAAESSEDPVALNAKIRVRAVCQRTSRLNHEKMVAGLVARSLPQRTIDVSHARSGLNMVEEQILRLEADRGEYLEMMRKAGAENVPEGEEQGRAKAEKARLMAEAEGLRADLELFDRFGEKLERLKAVAAKQRERATQKAQLELNDSSLNQFLRPVDKDREAEADSRQIPERRTKNVAPEKPPDEDSEKLPRKPQEKTTTTPLTAEPLTDVRVTVYHNKCQFTVDGTGPLCNRRYRAHQGDMPLSPTLAAACIQRADLQAKFESSTTSQQQPLLLWDPFCGSGTLLLESLSLLLGHPPGNPNLNYPFTRFPCHEPGFYEDVALDVLEHSVRPLLRTSGANALENLHIVGSDISPHQLSCCSKNFYRYLRRMPRGVDERDLSNPFLSVEAFSALQMGGGKNGSGLSSSGAANAAEDSKGSKAGGDVSGTNRSNAGDKGNAAFAKNVLYSVLQKLNRAKYPIPPTFLESVGDNYTSTFDERSSSTSGPAESQVDRWIREAVRPLGGVAFYEAALSVPFAANLFRRLREKNVEPRVVIVTNVPYGARKFDKQQLLKAYSSLGDVVRKFGGRVVKDVFVVSATDSRFLDFGAATKLDWRTELRFANGGLPVELLRWNRRF